MCTAPEDTPRPSHSTHATPGAAPSPCARSRFTRAMHGLSSPTTTLQQAHPVLQGVALHRAPIKQRRGVVEYPSAIPAGPCVSDSVRSNCAVLEGAVHRAHPHPSIRRSLPGQCCASRASPGTPGCAPGCAWASTPPPPDQTADPGAAAPPAPSPLGALQDLRQRRLSLQIQPQRQRAFDKKAVSGSSAARSPPGCVRPPGCRSPPLPGCSAGANSTAQLANIVMYSVTP